MSELLELIAAVFTPFTADGALDLKPVAAQVDRLIRDRVDGAFVGGTTGEGMSMTTVERKALAAHWMTAARGRLKVLVHAGHASLGDATELASHAENIGAAGVAAVAPFFMKPVGIDDLVACLAQIAQAAPTLPFFYYHIPMVTGIAVPAADVVEKLKRAIPNFGGVKFTDDDLTDLKRVVDLSSPSQRVYFGRDDMLTDALALGVHGAVGMSYNFAGRHIRRLHAALTIGDTARVAALQDDVKTLLGMAFPHGLTNVLKAVSARWAVDCGPSRLPLRTIDAVRLDELLRPPATHAAIERLLN